MKYRGNCHCKNVSFEVDMEMTGIISCNCSYCSIKGLVLGFVPRSALTFLSGEENLTIYKFNKHVLDHPFCKDCGTQGFAFGDGPDGTSIAAINMRALDGVDLDTLPVTSSDGKTL